MSAADRPIANTRSVTGMPTGKRDVSDAGLNDPEIDALGGGDLWLEF